MKTIKDIKDEVAEEIMRNSPMTQRHAPTDWHGYIVWRMADKDEVERAMEKVAERYAQQRVNEVLEWTDASILPEEKTGGYLVKFKTNTGDLMQCVASFQMVSQYQGKDSPKHPTWYVYPSSGHQIKVIEYLKLKNNEK